MMERRPCKRRKLSSASSATTDSTCVPQRLSPDAFPQSSVSDGVGGETTSTSCVTCHHSLLGKPNHIVICPRYAIPLLSSNYLVPLSFPVLFIYMIYAD